MPKLPSFFGVGALHLQAQMVAETSGGNFGDSCGADGGGDLGGSEDAAAMNEHEKARGGSTCFLFE